MSPAAGRRPLPPAQAALVERIADRLAEEPTAREQAMFGGRVFLVEDRIVVSAGKSGDLLVRVPPERSEELLARPGAAQAEMGKGRSMGPSWITVAADAIADDEAFDAWVTLALAHCHANT